MRSWAIGRAVAAAALVTAAGAPVHAQFFYPTIIVPPPAQHQVMPRQTPKPAQPSANQGQQQPPDPAPIPQGGDRYQGRTLVR